MKLHSALFTTVKAPPPPHFVRRNKRFSVYIASSATPEPTLAESLQSETLKILEWPSVCNQVSAFTSTTMGISAARNGRIPLGRSPEESRKLLAQTSAAVALPRSLDFSGIEDVSEIVSTSVSGELLSMRELCSVRRTLGSARALLMQLEELCLDEDSLKRYSSLLEILQKCDFLIELEQKIGFCIDCNLSIILDRASEDLEIIRSERKMNMETLESLLKQVSTQIFQGGGIDRPLVTRRRSRMCVGIRSSHRSFLQEGVLLGVSSSGMTYFMEPKEAVEMNNMEVRLSNAKKMEEKAILSLLTSEIAESKREIKFLLDKILELDLAFARAAHARWMNGVCPVLSLENYDCLSVDIEGIQHPLLLEKSLKRISNSMVDSEIVSYQSDFPVPIDIKIGYGTRVVVISGPNTGGKTASMKTLGLASVMLKAGLYIPARNHPRIPWFDLILADIGDHQSLEQSLSTFSGHISKLCKIMEVASEKSLVLLDEIGSGTDPSEGVALSASILQYLKNRVNLAIVTTHYADLTHLKQNDSRFENAAMEFSLETLQPTYQLLWGSMGESNALSIAKLIGFDERIIDRAKEWVEKLKPEKLNDRRGRLYQSLMEERNRLESQAKRAAAVRWEIMNVYHKIREETEDLERREAEIMAKETQQIQLELQAAKSEIEAIIMNFENQLKIANADQFNSLLKKSESKIASIVEAHSPSDVLSVRERDKSAYLPQIGETVYLKGLGNKSAIVVEAPGDDGTVLVQYGKMRVRVNIGNVKTPPSSDIADKKSSVRSVKRQGSQVRNLKNTLEARNEEISYGAVLQTSKNTVDLRGMRAEEASEHLKMAINTRGSGSVIFVIHGMGSGVVKERALEILKNHPGIAKFEQESPMNYGCTVAYIKG